MKERRHGGRCTNVVHCKDCGVILRVNKHFNYPGGNFRCHNCSQKKIKERQKEYKNIVHNEEFDFEQRIGEIG